MIDQPVSSQSSLAIKLGVSRFWYRNVYSPTFGTFRDGEQDARDEGLAIVWLLEYGHFFTKSGAVTAVPKRLLLVLLFDIRLKPAKARSVLADIALTCQKGGGCLENQEDERRWWVTYVPGFWSVNGLNSTVWTSMVARLCE